MNPKTKNIPSSKNTRLSHKTIVVGLSTRDGVTTNNTYKNVSHMCTSQEEADTILMFHAVDVASQNKNAAIHILSTDTDALILALAYFPILGANPRMLIGHGKSRELIVLKPIYDVLGFQARIWHLAHIANPILAPWMDKRGELSLSCENITKTSSRCCDLAQKIANERNPNAKTVVFMHKGWPCVYRAMPVWIRCWWLWYIIMSIVSQILMRRKRMTFELLWPFRWD